MASLRERLARFSLKALGYNVPARSSLNLDWFGSVPIYTNWSDTKYISEGFFKNPGLYAIVNRITSVAATCPFAVYRVKNETKARKYKNWTGERATKESLERAMLIKSEAYELDTSHELNKLIERPNEWQRQDEFTQTCIGFKLLQGERVLFLTKLDMGARAGKPTTVTNLPPQFIAVKPGNSLFEIGSFELNLSTPLQIPKENIIFSRYWNPNYTMSGDHLRGLSPLRAASKLLDRMGAAQDRSTIMLQNQGAAGLLFNKAVEALNPEQAAQIKRQVNTEVLGVENAGKIAVANGDIGYLSFGMSSVDLALLDQEKWSLTQLCNIYKVPPGLFVEMNPTDNNISAWNRQFLAQAVIPALSDLRDDWNEIAAMWGNTDEVYIDYDLTVFPELQEDLNVLATRLDKAWYMKPNEKRIAMGMDEDLEEPMMNRYLVPSGLTDITDLDPTNIDREMDRAEREFNNQQQTDEL